MSSTYISTWLFGSIMVAALLLKRSIRGPQPWFARVASMCLLVGIAGLRLSDQRGGVMSWTGAIFLLLGLISATVMLAVDIWWMLRHRNDAPQQQIK